MKYYNTENYDNKSPKYSQKKSYLIAKKIKLAFYKTVTFLSRTFTGQWKKKKADTNS